MNGEDGNHWHDEAMSGMVEQLDSLQAYFTRRILKDASLADDDKRDKVDIWMDQNAEKVGEIMNFFENLRKVGTVDLSMLIVAEQKLRRLYGG